MAKKAKRMMDGGMAEPAMATRRMGMRGEGRPNRQPRMMADGTPRQRPERTPEEIEARKAKRMERREDRKGRREDGVRGFNRDFGGMGGMGAMREKFGPMMEKIGSKLGDRLPEGMSEKISKYTSALGLPGILGPRPATPLPPAPASPTMKKGGMVKPAKRYNKGGMVKGCGCAARGVKKAKMS